MKIRNAKTFNPHHIGHIHGFTTSEHAVFERVQYEKNTMTLFRQRNWKKRKSIFCKSSLSVSNHSHGKQCLNFPDLDRASESR